MEDKQNEVAINVQVEVNDADIEKATRLVELLKEAKSLVDDLASAEFNINVKWKWLFYCN